MVSECNLCTLLTVANKEFPSLEAIEKAFNHFAFGEGYSIVIKTLCKQQNGCYCVYYKCNCGRSYYNHLDLIEEKQIHTTSSALSSCRFK